MIKMLNQKEEINKLEWDILVILDACRYDYFSEHYEEYFTGKLYKARSSARSTGGWFERTWPDYYSIVYFSASPFTSDTKWETGKWKPTEHFEKIISIWNEGWSKDLNTVHPREVNKAIAYTRGFIEGKKFVVHYLQPHGPWIGKTPLPLTDIEALRKVDLDLLKRAYRDNLILVMEYVKKMLKRFPERKVVITSDHGETLGEEGSLLHPGTLGPNNFITKDVPWLEILK